MTTTTETTQVTDLAAEYKSIQEKIADDLERMAQIEDQVRDMEPGAYETSEGTFTVSEYRRFNAGDAIDQMSDRSLRRVLVEKVDARKVKELFPGIYRRAQRQYQNRVSFEAN